MLSILPRYKFAINPVSCIIQDYSCLSMFRYIWYTLRFAKR